LKEEAEGVVVVVEVHTLVRGGMWTVVGYTPLLDTTAAHEGTPVRKMHTTR